MLETAVDQKIEEQAEFVRWWDGAVGVRHGLNRHNVDITDRLSLPKTEAEKLTGISAMQVSRWRRRLQDTEKYKALLYSAAYK